jgi:hypothetical protein
MYIMRVHLPIYFSMNNDNKSVVLGGLVVIVLATGPKVAGSNPAEDDEF